MVGPDGLSEALDAGEGKFGAELFGIAVGGHGVGVDGGFLRGFAPVDVGVVEEGGKVVEGGAAAHTLEVDDGGGFGVPEDVGALEVAVDEDGGFGEEGVLDTREFGLGLGREGRGELFVEGDLPGVEGGIEGRFEGKVADIGAVEGCEQFHDLAELGRTMMVALVAGGLASAEAILADGGDVAVEGVIAEVFHYQEIREVEQNLRDGDVRLGEGFGASGVAGVFGAAFGLVGDSDGTAAGRGEAPEGPLAAAGAERGDDGLVHWPLECGEGLGDGGGLGVGGAGGVAGKGGKALGVAVGLDVGGGSAGVVPVRLGEENAADEAIGEGGVLEGVDEGADGAVGEKGEDVGGEEADAGEGVGALDARGGGVPAGDAVGVVELDGAGAALGFEPGGGEAAGGFEGLGKGGGVGVEDDVAIDEPEGAALPR